MAIATAPHYVRRMTLDDIDEAVEIERQSFPSTWPRTLYKRELQQNSMARYLLVELAPGLRDGSTATPGYWLAQVRRLFGGVPEAWETGPKAEIGGFIGLWFMAGEAHIVTLAVAERQRRRGLAELLLFGAFDLAVAHHQDVLSLECRVSNTIAQRLYEKFGFHHTGVRPHYYSDDGEDAVIMTTEALTSPAMRERVARLRREHEERWGAHLRAPDLLA